MKTLWITYAWEDNKEQSVDFIAQELKKKGINVQLDRSALNAGQRIWEQIDTLITEEADALLFYATQNSLSSQPCKEELAYALNRVLEARGENFPIIALFPSSIEESLIPAAIKTRLYIRLDNDNWLEQIVASLEQRPLNIPQPDLKPYHISVKFNSVFRYIISIRPRAGSWSPFTLAIPNDEKLHVNGKNRFAPQLRSAPKEVCPFQTGGMWSTREWLHPDNSFYCYQIYSEATPSQSYYFICENLPTKIIFASGKNQWDECPSNYL